MTNKQWEQVEPIRVRIMSRAYDCADRGDNEAYNSIKVMCSEVLEMVTQTIKNEREACAKLCEEIAESDTWEGGYAAYCADMIRKRGHDD